MPTSLQRYGAFVLLFIIVGLLTACGPGSAPAPTQTPWIIVVTNTPAAATATPAPTMPPTPAASPTSVPPAPARLIVYQGSGAPFSVQYPSNWVVNDQEKEQQLVTMVSPDSTAYLLVAYGPGGSLSAEEATTKFLQSFNLPALKFGGLKKNADGSVSLDLEFNDQSSGAPWLGQMRVVKQSTSSNFYVIMFAAGRSSYDASKVLAGNLLTSFQERASIARTPPPIVSIATATPTPRPARPTDTPAPTDTPEPTNTPRPATVFHTEVSGYTGYETWGAPKDGCNSGATQQWDNTHPVRRLTFDLTVYNDSSRLINFSDIGWSAVDTAGRDLLMCYYSATQTIAAHGTGKYRLVTFVEMDAWLATVRTSIFGGTVRDCFAPRNSADVVPCR